MKRKIGLRPLILSCVTALILAGCGHSSPSSPPQLTAEQTLAGDWSLQDVRCNGQATSVLSDQLLAEGGISLELDFSGGTGSRIWKSGGCTLTVPFTQIVYSSTQLTITAGAASCQEATPGACAAFGTQCSAPADTETDQLDLASSKITLGIPADPPNLDPCNANWADNVTFTLDKTNQ